MLKKKEKNFLNSVKFTWVVGNVTGPMNGAGVRYNTVTVNIIMLFRVQMFFTILLSVTVYEKLFFQLLRTFLAKTVHAILRLGKVSCDWQMEIAAKCLGPKIIKFYSYMQGHHQRLSHMHG